MASYVVQDTQLTAIASAIRTKSGTTEGMTVEEMPSKISEIEVGGTGEGGTDTSGDTVTPETLVTGYTAHDASGEPITGVNPYELESTNATVEEQADLIAQIQTALEGKAAGGGSYGNASINTCTVTINSFAANIKLAKYSSFENGEHKWNEITYSPEVGNVTLTNVIQGSYVHILSSYGYCYFEFSGNYEGIWSGWDYISFAPFGDISLTIIDDD